MPNRYPKLSEMKKLVRDDPKAVYDLFMMDCEAESPGFQADMEKAMRNGFSIQRIAEVIRESVGPPEAAEIFLTAVIWKYNSIKVSLDDSKILVLHPEPDWEM